MKIYYWKYYLSYGNLTFWRLDVDKETEECFFTLEKMRFSKTTEGKPEIKDRTSYPYIDVWFREDKTSTEVAEIIINYLKEHWGLK